MEYAINEQAMWALISPCNGLFFPSNQHDPGILINLSDEIAKSSAAMWLKGTPFFQLKMFPVSLSQTEWFVQGYSHPITFVEPLSHAKYFYSRPIPLRCLSLSSQNWTWPVRQSTCAVFTFVSSY